MARPSAPRPRRARAPATWLVALFLVLAACDGERARYCNFGDALVLSSADETGFASLAAVELGGSLHVLYSTDAGLHRVQVSNGHAQAVERLGPRCDMLSVARLEDSLVAACGIKPRASKDDPGVILLLRIGARTTQRVLPWPIGEGHAGLSLAVNDSWLELVFHDGLPDQWGVWHARIGANLEPLDDARLLSSGRATPGAPHITIGGGERFITWTEGWVERNPRFDDYAGTVFLQRSPSSAVSGGRPERVTDVHHSPSQPFVSMDASGPVLLFRDVRAPNHRAGLFAQRLTDGAEARRVGRSNGPFPPSALTCGDSLITLTPRTFGPSDVLIGMHLLNSSLEDRVPEQQVYEWSAQFENAAGACVNETLWVAVAERHRLSSVPARLHLLSLVCE